MARLLHTRRPRRRVLLIAAGTLVVLLALGLGGHGGYVAKAYGAATQTPQSGTAGATAVVLTADKTPAPSTATTTPAPGSSGEGPPGIQVGPGNTTTPSVPAPGSGGTVSGGSQPSPGLFDITGHITAAIDNWFRDLVTAALDPILTLLGHTLLATPNVTAQSRVGELWRMTEGIADAFLVLFVLVGGAIVMGHETVQTRTAIKDILPRIVVAGIAVNASLSLAGLAISTADSLSQAVLGQGVDPSGAAVVLRQLVLGSLADGGIFVVLLGGVVAVLAMVVLATYVVRLALVILLVVAAPICLVCHALPQTEGLAKLWWRAFFGVLAVQVAQSLVLVTALRVFLASGGPANLGIASTGGLVDLLVSACLCWVLVKIPSWVSRFVFSGSRGHSGVGRVVRDVIIYKGAKALAAGVGL
ncbi:hypothetical protein K6U06_23595 [Acidiferrimicrobium sp. IK]|uniref:conjugal transfer protein TrbL family protein n=1 Tax=Acidiferrimicrobium sp. IK TaxID=2871700 RepID=UPI0021CB097D|nr:conjugal transfer protein TrbL family protein [Acidiferrimicrobium sp. IK]MCU4187367.1 hypothetical protein [Acidiferrimicrobium sp. IK]